MLIKKARLTFIAIGLSAASVIMPVQAADKGVIAYVKDPKPVLQEGAVPVDARALSACEKRSVPNARCLPAADFLGPHGRLASIRDILWLLGSAGLAGDEHVLVVGNEPVERDFLAGILYLAGQKRVSILTEPVSRGAGLDKESLKPGDGRTITRQAVFQGPVRDHLIILRSELAGMMGRGNSPALIDGRSEGEYWGKTVRGFRGGHIPGAQHLSAAVLRSSLASDRALAPDLDSPVVYGHDPFEGVAFLTLLAAGAGLHGRVYLEGWADWAATTALPADSVTYPDRVRAAASAPAPRPRSGVSWPLLAAAAFGGGALVFGGFMVGKRSSG